MVIRWSYDGYTVALDGKVDTGMLKSENDFARSHMPAGRHEAKWQSVASY